MVELCGDSNGNESPHCHNCYAQMAPETTFLLVRFSICLLLLTHLSASTVEEHNKRRKKEVGTAADPFGREVVMHQKRKKKSQELTHCWLWQLQQSSSH